MNIGEKSTEKSLIFDTFCLFSNSNICFHTVRNLHFLSKNSTLISRENCRFFLGEKLVKILWFWTFQLLTTLISREKLSKKNLCEELVKMLGFLSKLNFWT